jgi:hypothetical protein
MAHQLHFYVSIQQIVCNVHKFIFSSLSLSNGISAMSAWPQWHTNIIFMLGFNILYVMYLKLFLAPLASASAWWQCHPDPNGTPSGVKVWFWTLVRTRLLQNQTLSSVWSSVSGPNWTSGPVHGSGWSGKFKPGLNLPHPFSLPINKNWLTMILNCCLLCFAHSQWESHISRLNQIK